MEVGDLATWVSAFGTIAAVAVALNLAGRESKRREEDRYARGRVIASFLFADVGIIHRAMELAAAALTKAQTAGSRDEMAAAVFDAYRIIEQADTMKIAAHMDKVVDLPARHAVAVAALPDNVKAIRSILIDQVNAGSSATVSALRDTADSCLAQISVTRARLDAFMADFEPQFVG